MNKELPTTYTAKKTVTLDDGLHNGEITSVTRELTESKTSGVQYDYTNIHILSDGMEDAISVGYPSTMSNLSGLGELASRFSETPIDFEGKQEVNLAELLEGKRCSFQTTTKTVQDKDGKDMQVSRIIKDTVKPE